MVLIIDKALPEKLTGIASMFIRSKLRPYDGGKFWRVPGEDAVRLLVGEFPDAAKPYLETVGFPPLPATSAGPAGCVTWLRAGGVRVTVA